MDRSVFCVLPFELQRDCFITLKLARRRMPSTCPTRRSEASLSFRAMDPSNAIGLVQLSPVLSIASEIAPKLIRPYSGCFRLLSATLVLNAARSAPT